MNWLIGGIVVLMLAAGGYYYVSMRGTENMIGEESMMDNDARQGEVTGSDAMMETSGSYQDYSADKLALANEGKVVLYFHADWCPICRPLDAEFKASSQLLSSGVNILKVHYDTATALKQKYGVTYQHTFVQVDAAGIMIAKWGDARNLAGVLAKVQ